MQIEKLSEGDWEVFGQYGRTMLTVQLFEFALQGLVQAQGPPIPEEGDFDEVWRKHVAPIFELTAGQAKNRLRDLDEELIDDLSAAVDARNYLAHTFLATYRIAVATGQTTPEEAVGALKELEGRFARVNQKLGAISDELDRAQGVDPDDPGLTPAEWEDILRAVREE